ncbi:MAG TPA: serpin family protein [Phycisphaerales bacterium]|nr:serpin family protein [Phycisphaerales bacterium]
MERLSLFSGLAGGLVSLGVGLGMAVALGVGACIGCAGEPGKSAGAGKPVVPANPPGARAGELAKENAAFAFDLFRELSAGKGDDVFFSPYSMSSAVGMLWAGARGATEEEIAKVMHWGMGQEATHDGFAGLANGLVSPVTKSGETLYEWSSANRLWMGIEVMSGYQERLVRSYGADAHRLDFGKPVESAGLINGWTKEWTRGHIEKIVEPEDMRELGLMLTNAVYFKGTWEEPFNKEMTRRGPFTRGDGSVVEKEMMHTTRRTLFATGEGFSAIRLSYKGGVSCVIMLPDEVGGDERLIASMSAERFYGLIGGMSASEVVISLPKVKIETRFNVNKELGRLGMVRAFSGDADFSAIDGKGQLAVSDVIHAATLEMDEVGTVATAVTAIGVRVTSAPMPGEIKVFNVDRPYVMAIVHDATGSVLFAGRVGK